MTKYQIKPSTELMENYMQATIMAPQKEFAALQSPHGRALLFSIGSDDTGSPFNVTVEVPGDRHGWDTVNLSKVIGNRPCQHFAVAHRAGGSIHAAMVLREGSGAQAKDALYLTNLSSDESGHVLQPLWTDFPFDGADAARPRIQVAGVFLSQATDGEYLIVDVVRDPDSPTKQIVRYFVDATRRDGRAWHLHDIPIDLEADRYASVLGRQAGEKVDGVYVSGQIDGAAQIVYTPLINEFRPDRPPASSYLRLRAEENTVADAIAACPNPDKSSDLYATANGVLYRFASTNQHHEATATVATRNPLFTGVRQLFAFDDDGLVVVWGRNADNVAFYTSCRRNQLDSPDAWSVALPILTGVQKVSPFVNSADRANTIFAHTGENQLRLGRKSPATPAWTWHDVTLPAGLKAPVRKINSYTTRIQVMDDQNQPAAKVRVGLSASNVTSVYINHLYYVVGPEAIHVETDATGSITIVEAVPELSGTRFTISATSETTADEWAINPMDKAFKKLSALQSVEQLRDARISRYEKGQRLPDRKLIRDGVDDRTLQQAAHLSKQCALAYADPKQGPPVAALAANVAHPFAIPADTPLVDAGDLFQYLNARSTEIKRRAARADAGTVHSEAAGVGAAAQESFWEMIVRWFEGAWEFVVKIGEAVFRCILTVVEHIVSAVRWVFEKIVAAIEDLVEFLRYLFEWDDFRRTKDVLKNVTKTFFQYQVDQIPHMRGELDKAVDGLVESIHEWQTKGFSDLGAAGANRLSRQGTSDGPDAPGGLLSHHFQANANNVSYKEDPHQPSETVLEALKRAVDSEKGHIGGAFDKLKDLFGRARNMSLVDILRELCAIFAEAVLRSAQVVIDALLDVIHTIAGDLLEFLDKPVHIPVISDILNAIGVPDFSMLDAICWVAAIPVTIGYKLGSALAGKGQAPFPDNAETKLLTESKDFRVIAAAFGQSHDAVRAAAMVPSSRRAPLSPTEKAVFISLHSAAGVCAWVSAFVDAFEAMTPAPLVSRALSWATVAAAFVGGVSRGVANYLIPCVPIDNYWGQQISQITLISFVANKLLWGGAGWLWPDGMAREIGAGVDMLLVLPAIAMTVWHFVTLGLHEEGKERTEGILDECSYLSTYIARVLYTVVVSGTLDANPEAKVAAAGGMGVAQIVHGILQFAEATVEGVA